MQNILIIIVSEVYYYLNNFLQLQKNENHTHDLFYHLIIYRDT